ncbi:MAG: DUF3540 domain-containing protein [Deltaproteobacteria bacterium]|nr:DUF3540 domain-containing protein [Deltaproteobacteria bacterium]
MTKTAPNRAPHVAGPSLRVVDCDHDLPHVEARRLRSEGGPSAVLHGDGAEERLEIRDAHDRVLFELDTVTGRALVRAPSGNLTLEAPEGDIELVAGKTVRCRGERVELRAERDGAALVLGRELAELTARGFTVAAARAELLFAETKLVGARVAAHLHDARLVAERVETTTERLFERARSVFRKVEELHQLEAGRTRTLVREGHIVKAGHAILKATEEVTIDGERIHLG